MKAKETLMKKERETWCQVRVERGGSDMVLAEIAFFIYHNGLNKAESTRVQIAHHKRVYKFHKDVWRCLFYNRDIVPKRHPRIASCFSLVCLFFSLFSLFISYKLAVFNPLLSFTTKGIKVGSMRGQRDIEGVGNWIGLQLYDNR